MPKISIDKERCKGCLLCVNFCPKGLIKSSQKLNKNGINYVEFLDKDNTCLGCMQCAIICPDCCIEVYR
ncbi:MAG: 4Fe-4S binding protein [Candidatus Omnitrophica bacterium]|nr:4Fe-4S binding protein [Candidatus Omnitrophota bacterium]MCM8799862.1 4Fe-4S binding protein [Candidatus Omnitrophota bacterium]